MKHRIAAIPGDGIGKEVVPEGMRVLDATGRRFGFEIEWTTFDWSCERYTQTGRMMPEDGLDQLRRFEGIFLGAVGFPGVPDHVSLWGLLIPIRRGFRQYVNLRPVRLLPGVRSPLRLDGAFFGESPSRYIVSVPSRAMPEMQSLARRHNVELVRQVEAIVTTWVDVRALGDDRLLERLLHDHVRLVHEPLVLRDVVARVDTHQQLRRPTEPPRAHRRPPLSARDRVRPAYPGS